MILETIAFLYLSFMVYYRYRPIGYDIMPAPRSFPVDDSRIRFIYDLNPGEYNIRDRIFRLLKKSKTAVIDVFLFNLQHIDNDFPKITARMAESLKGTECLFITDPLNEFYGAHVCEPIEWLKEQGVHVCLTDLRKLRDHSPIYSGLWRMLFQWFPIKKKRKVITSPLQKDKSINILSALMALNAKANHRKVFVCDSTSVVSSGNMDNASAYFSNAAVEVKDEGLASYLSYVEREVARMSGCICKNPKPDPARKGGDTKVTTLFGKHIKESLIKDIRGTRKGDQIHIGMLFLSDKASIRELNRASRRGVKVCVVLDNNLYSFHQPKSGIPNQVTAYLMRSAEVRFYNSKEEYHPKIVYIKKKGQSILHAGSANLTHKHLTGTNLEANLRLHTASGSRLDREVDSYFTKIEKEPYSSCRKGRMSIPLYLFFKFQDVTGLSTF